MARKAFIERGAGKPPWFVRTGLNGQRLFFKMSKIPGVGRHHPWVTAEKTDVRFVPINSGIEMPESWPMPLQLVDRLIEEASHRVIVDFCGCRPGAHRGQGSRGRLHLRRQGPRRLLTVCFCCECCSITRFIRDVPLDAIEPAYVPMEGVRVEVTGKCKGCGRCVEHCFVKAIEIVEGRAVIGPYCRACGRCASACSNGGVVVRVDDPDFLEKTYQRIRAHVKFD